MRNANAQSIMTWVVEPHTILQDEGNNTFVKKLPHLPAVPFISLLWEKSDVGVN